LTLRRGAKLSRIDRCDATIGSLVAALPPCSLQKTQARLTPLSGKAMFADDKRRLIIETVWFHKVVISLAERSGTDAVENERYNRRSGVTERSK
jgi:hypothetical protein